MYIKQTSLIGANLDCHLRYMFAKYLMEWGIRPACTGIPGMYNALRYSLHVCYICYILDHIFDPRYLVTDPQSHGS